MAFSGIFFFTRQFANVTRELPTQIDRMDWLKPFDFEIDSNFYSFELYAAQQLATSYQIG